MAKKSVFIVGNGALPCAMLERVEAGAHDVRCINPKAAVGMCDTKTGRGFVANSG